MKKISIQVKFTDRDSDALTRHLNDIRKYKLLTIEEEIELAKKIKLGDVDAKNRFICANARFVVSVAKTFYAYGVSLPDLVSEGNLGLIEAARRYDESKGFKFITYSVWYIRQYIHKYIVEQRGLIRIPGNQRIILAKINKVNQEFEHTFHRSATYEEIAERTDLSLQQVKDSLSNPGQVLHLDRMIGEKENLALIDVVVNENSVIPDHDMIIQSDNQNVIELLAILSERQRNIVQHFFGLNGFSRLTLDEIAEVVKLSKERTRQLKDEGIKLMRWSSKGKSMFNNS
ncbi:MAG: RNA polymerase sigma factor RpoD/SigA [Bacteroidota bacterium]